jgi:hypothetical protein
MLRAEEDYERGTLKGARHQAILEHVDEWVDERLEMLSGAKARLAPMQATDTAPAILCVPASDKADEIIAKLFEAALIERNLGARIIGPRDAIDRLSAHCGVRAVVISALPPEAVTAARTVCKRIRLEEGQVPIIVGLWRAEGDLDRPKQRLASAGATETVVTFSECLTSLETLVDVPNLSPADEALTPGPVSSDVPALAGPGPVPQT